MYLVIGADDHAAFCAAERRFGGLHLLGHNTEAISVTVEQHALVFALRAFGGLDPLTPASALVHALEET
jgi:hypothetical protein